MGPTRGTPFSAGLRASSVHLRVGLVRRSSGGAPRPAAGLPFGATSTPIMRRARSETACHEPVANVRSTRATGWSRKVGGWSGHTLRPRVKAGAAAVGPALARNVVRLPAVAGRLRNGCEPRTRYETGSERDSFPPGFTRGVIGRSHRGSVEPETEQVLLHILDRSGALTRPTQSYPLPFRSGAPAATGSSRPWSGAPGSQLGAFGCCTGTPVAR